MDRQEYNKKYYSENKGTILNKLKEKEDCPLCGRSVNHQNIMKHKISKYCLSRRGDMVTQQGNVSDIEDLKQEIQLLKDTLNKFVSP